MKKRFMQFAAAVLALVLCVPSAQAVRGDEDGELMIRVGLASTSSHNELGVQEAAHLQNNTDYGAGYRFGYYDSELNFIELARTNEKMTEIAVLKTQNMYYGYVSDKGKYTYSSSIASSVAVGCYHIQVPGIYDDYEEAQEAAENYGGFVAWINGEYQVRVGAYLDKESAQAALATMESGSVVGTSSYGMSVVETGTNHILFQFDDGASRALGVLPDVTGAEDVRTWFSGFKYRGGFTYQRIGGSGMTVVNVLELEDYVKGVICYEMGREWPLEALKAQAICARTYVLRRLNYHNSLGFDICNSDWCQVYRGVGSGRVDYGPSEVSDRAVEETAGQVLWYKEELAETFYSSSHGGASESAYNIWNTSMEKYPYLCGVIDPYEETIAHLNANSSWKVSYTASSLAKRLQNYGYGVGSSIESLELTYSELGNVLKIVVHWANGKTNTFRSNGSSSAKNDIRSSFNLNSIRFTVNGETVQSGGGSSSAAAGGTFAVNGSGELDNLEGLFVISDRGTVTTVPEGLYTISGKGKISKLDTQQKGEPSGSNEGGGTVEVSGTNYVFEGAGLGHQIGLSQFGANAMARLGFDGDEIVEFYFPGTNVGDYK